MNNPVPEPLPLDLTVTPVAGAPFGLTPETPPGWFDRGDGRGVCRHPGPPVFYAQPKRYTLTHYADDGRVGSIEVAVGGAPAVLTGLPQPVLDSDALVALGFGGTDNGVSSVGGSDGRLLYFFSDTLTEDGWQTWENVVVRLAVWPGEPLTTGEVHVAKVAGNPFRGPALAYLDAGGVVRYGGRLWMLCLSGRAVPFPQFGAQALRSSRGPVATARASRRPSRAPKPWDRRSAGAGVLAAETVFGTHGGLELIYSDDDGRTWTYFGTAVAQPFTYEQHQAAGAPVDAANMAGCLYLVRNADGDGKDYLYSWLSQAEEGGRANPCCVARADLVELTTAVDLGGETEGLWKKLRYGAWEAPYTGVADVLLSCGGGPDITWCEPLGCYLLLTAAPAGTGESLYYLHVSPNGLDGWSQAAVVYAEQRIGRFHTVPRFDAPEGSVGQSFRVLIGPCWLSDPSGAEIRSLFEVWGTTVTLV